MKLITLLKEITVNKPSLIFGITDDGEHLNFELDENLELIVNNKNLKSLTVRDKRIKGLYCINNDLTSLDIKGLTNLKELYCSDNDLTFLDIRRLTNLKELSCSHNRLTSLDVNGLTNLEYLDCNTNNLTSLNVQGCVNLEYLYCYNNDLTSLDIRGLTKLNTLNYDKRLDKTILIY